MGCRIGGDKVIFADDNNNGFFAEFNRDAVYVGRSIYGVPFGQYLLLDGEIFEIKVNETGTSVRYRKYKGEWGYADLTSEWGGTKPPEAAIIQARRMLGGTCFNVCEGDEPRVPAAKYQIIGGYLEDVVIESKRARLFFEVEWKQTAKVEWGVGLKLTAPYQYDPETGELNISPEFEIKGKHGEFYRGAFLNTRKYHAWVQFLDAEGAQVGTKTKWSMDDVEVDPFNTEVMWIPFQKVKPEGAVKALVTMEVPGVGEAPMEIDLQQSSDS
ncbi:MAG: hypothetical protein U5N86_04205 [Planctomycetota bacterium]|nr:hypothetical protein [Planctomycetota bacterium]